jgi:hypothetical protein
MKSKAAGSTGGNLYVLPSSLEELAKNQDDASSAFGKAAKATDESDSGDSVMHDLRLTHGAISVAFIHEMDSTLAVRTNAAALLASASSGAAQALREAKKRYEGTDTELGEDIDAQMPDD